MTHKYTNALIDETSPYLLQHAHNPVKWVAWSPEALTRAEKEHKLVLISIGYAACHWCHVMEHECFEDAKVAEVMNERFINIKVDREERPDVDQIYMDALQMMTGSGGWPLNIVALPDGRPFWGATYVKKDNWIQVLRQLSELHRNEPEKIEGYAENMVEGLQAVNLIETKKGSDRFALEGIEATVKDWSRYFDTKMGGYNRAPKFPMPVNLTFLLHYATARKDDGIMDYVNTTLTQMARGGIFDQVGGGFSRYSVDTKWHVPHFEKMLYDNGQLVSLYAQAYAATRNGLYRQTVEKSIAFVESELMADDFGFYSSLDADNLDENGRLEEGAYYVWKEAELKHLLGNRYPLFQEVFNINDYGHWEHGNHVLIRNASEESIAEKYSLEVEKLRGIIEESLHILKSERDQRNRPRLDNKILTSWNGLMLKGLLDAHRYLENEAYLDLALKNADFILKNLFREDGGLFHTRSKSASKRKSTPGGSGEDSKSESNGTNDRGSESGSSDRGSKSEKDGMAGSSDSVGINGYLEDYASVIEAFIALYEATFDETWLERAESLIHYCQVYFFDENSGMFFFTSKADHSLIRRTIETTDNVVPASNSIMAKNLFRLSHFFPETEYSTLALQMLKNVQHQFTKNAQGHVNWLQLALLMNRPFYEVAIIGDHFEQKAKELRSQYLPNSILAATEKESPLPLFKDRYTENNTLIYVCQQGACQLPVVQTAEALAQLRPNRMD
ncbi:MAG TPA: thioredoxin domain-containing protein [Pricia sp.]|nr:thioredoxin domain-containing protein [Pricia sp.]